MQRNSESGRSMTEIFAVLALIGLLSIGSLSGYEYGYAAYQAGQLRDTLFAAKKSASMNVSAAQAREVRRLLRENLPQYGITLNSKVEEHDRVYEVIISEVSSRICRQIVGMSNVLTPGGIHLTQPADNTGCNGADTVVLKFAFQSAGS